MDTFFPFTHPSFELEVKFNNVWVELLGCGIIQQNLLKNAGVEEKVRKNEEICLFFLPLNYLQL